MYRFQGNVQEFKILAEPNIDSVVDDLSDSMKALKINVSEVLHNSIIIYKKFQIKVKNHFNMLFSFTKSN